ncbi:MAG: mechanosensitive ion channel family protein, partial [candidate division Zixibacteria bacterium]|nr:mechanosensitive ion channel family protein [candidate division Zixibacteria bacterium]NIV05176.1 mechanosensitive ion channel family protein [candidate division Zixibacteria bacterium]NIX54469.1 mechanosensitive ion channel family protein [candidate division Zixibacteria bacterium]
MDIELYLQKTIDWLLSSGLRVLLILILTFVAIKVGRIISAKLFSEISKRKEEDEFRKRADTLSSMIRYAL